MMTFGENAVKFYKNLEPPEKELPGGVEIMNPLRDNKVIRIIEQFYHTYYNDKNERVFLIGINPGRFGGGVTGIPFTDPLNLENVLGIPNDLEKRHELSSRFIYRVVEEFGGPEKFFGRFYLTAVSPLGYTIHDKNMNYYEVKRIKGNWESWLIEKMEEQINFGARTDLAISLGKGKNLDFLTTMNHKANLFNKIGHLPHPRWVMQYNYKKREKFVKQYVAYLDSKTKLSE